MELAGEAMALRELTARLVHGLAVHGTEPGDGRGAAMSDDLRHPPERDAQAGACSGAMPA